jgi:hypothetical protein
MIWIGCCLPAARFRRGLVEPGMDAGVDLGLDPGDLGAAGADTLSYLAGDIALVEHHFAVFAALSIDPPTPSLRGRRASTFRTIPQCSHCPSGQRDREDKEIAPE